MKVLVIGSGAREHAIVWKCVQSDLVERVFCAPGNGGTGGMARNIAIAPTDVVRLVSFAKQERLGLVILGPEAAVEAGAGDALRDAGFQVFGPGREAGRIESSKSFAKALMRRAGIPTADFDTFTQPAPAKAWAAARDGQVAVKADGLARGKGVIVCSGVKESDAAIEAMLVENRFGKSGATVVVEERLEGPELALLGVTDRPCVGIVVASGHYPDEAGMQIGFPIRGLAEMPRGVLIFHAGTRFEPGRGLVTDGGRVVTAVALGDTVAQARETALSGARQVRFEGAFYRSDIALEGLD